jgi:LAS superfamily LD-carboxypeptidase LdcB
MVALCGVALLALVPMAGALVDRARARTAADAAALAGAAEGDQAARQVATANGAKLLEIERSGDEVVVQVRVGEVEAYAKARGVRGRSTTGATAGSLSAVRGITVHSSIAAQLGALLDAAESDGIALTGTGYRSTQHQIQLRRAHCGSTHYAIYEAPASSCSPPTARPGTSMHERGLAVDFGDCGTRSTACWQWLDAHAATFGFFNLPSEPWHWSIDGT